MITGGDTGGEDHTTERTGYLNEAQACSYIQRINLIEEDKPRKVNKDKLVIGFSKMIYQEYSTPMTILWSLKSERKISLSQEY